MPNAQAIANKTLNDREKLESLEVIQSQPQRIVFEASNKCNLKCEMCGHSHRDFEGKNLKLKHFEACASVLPTAYDVSLFGWGEPFLNEHLGRFFDDVIRNDSKVFILTNGLLLKEKLVEHMIESGLEYLNFSFDGTTKEVYEKIRRGSNFERVLANIQKIVEMKRKHGKKTPYLRMVFVGMRQNIHQFPDFVRLAAELGMDEAKLVHMVAYGHEMKDEILYYDKEKTNLLIDEGRKLAEDLGIALTLPEKFDLESPQKQVSESKPSGHRKPCYRPWEELFVESDGKVRLCMLSHEIMGDLEEQPIEEIWNNERFQTFRATVNSENPISTCAACPQYKEMNVNDIGAFLQMETQLPGTKGQDVA
ncbi:MAG: radical SAM protein [bacterium]|nr:radical SAM protein [bacterium]